MFDSLKLIQSIKTTELDGLSLEQVVEKFQTTSDEAVQNKCFAKVFCDLFPMILKLHHKYGDLTLEERTEECIFRTYHSMKKYNVRNNKTKFSSFLYVVITNSLKSLIHAQNNYNKRVWKHVVVCDEETTKYIQNNIPAQDKIAFKDLLLDLDNSSILNSREVDYCKSLLCGYTHNSQIVNLIDLTTTVKYNKAQHKYITEPIATNARGTYLSKLKRGLKTKIRDNNFSLI